MYLEDLVECVIANNSLCQAAGKELIIDKGKHKDTVIENNPGSVRNSGGVSQ